MPTRNYTNTEENGLIVETERSRNDQAVEIFDKDSGILVDALNDITDLRNARDSVDSGDIIRVYPGEYVTRDLLKDGVDWNFLEDTTLKNPDNEVGSFFTNGPNGTESGAVESTITGDAEFIIRNQGGGDENTHSVLRLLDPGTEVNFTCKLIDKQTENFGSFFFLPTVADVDVRVDEVHFNKFQPLAAAYDPGLFPQNNVSDTRGTKHKIHYGTFDISDVPSGDLMPSMMTTFGITHHGKLEIITDNLVSPENYTIAFEMVFNDNSSTEGWQKASIRNHSQGVIGKFVKNDAPKPMIVPEIDVTIAETQPNGNPTAGISFSDTDNTNLYVGEGEIRSPDFDSNTGNFPILAENGATGSTLHATGTLKITDGQSGVDPDVTTEGANIESL